MQSKIKDIVSTLNNIKLPNFHSQHWLYQHHLLLAHINVVTDEQATEELKDVAEQQVMHNKFQQAMSTICKLHDLFDWYFYDETDYEPVSLKEIKHRLVHFEHQLVHHTK